MPAARKGSPRSRSEPIFHLTVAEASRRVAAAELSPVAIVEAYLARIDEVDARVHTYVHVARGDAIAAARTAEREIKAGRLRGPLHGLPFAVKDNYDAAGLPCQWGSKLGLGRIAEKDAALIADLKAAGAILLGKLTTWEYGTGNGGEYFDLPFPAARNPWNTEYFTGGSSTGSGAAVASGTAMFALGSDTTGSVRIPAAMTGTVGVITTPGRLPLDGILPNCYSLDTPGTMTWTLEDAALVLGEIGAFRGSADGKALLRGLAGGVKGLRIAVVRDPGPGFPDPDKAVGEAFETGLKVLEGLGARLNEVRLPVPSSECLAVTRQIGPAESASIHEAELLERPEDMGFALRDKLLVGSMIRAVDYINALRRRRLIADALDGLMRQYDALITYGTLHTPPRLGVEPEMTATTTDTMMTPFNLSAHPAMVQCTGFTDGGLPLHWQIVANRGEEATMLRVAAAYEAATPWRQRRPAI